MKCTEFEKQIALAAEGDLPGKDAARVEAHLRECAACRVFAGRLRESQAALKSLAEESADPAALARVRERVLARVEAESRRKPVRIWAWGFALAAVVILLVLAARPKPAPPVIALHPPAPPPPPPQLVAPERRLAPHVRTRLVRARRKRPAGGEDHPLLIKLFTDDPNIVIYWIVEKKGD